MAIKTFDDQNDPQGQMPPTQTAVLKSLIKSFSQQLRVSMPATIVTYDYKTQMATVQPSFSNKYNDGTVSPMPQIFNVPMRWDSSSTSYTHHPLAAGDQCTLSFSDKALDLWLSSGAASAPNDNRTHHIADAWAEPGLRSFNKPLKISNGTDYIFGINNLQFRLKPNGHLQIFTGLDTSGSLEMVTLINQFMLAVITDDIGGAAAVQDKFKNFVEE